MNYESQYNKYKKQYIDMVETYMDIGDIKLVKKYIKYLPHYTSYENFKNIMKSGMLIPSTGFDVVMVSAFLKNVPKGWSDEYTGTENFYMNMCYQYNNIVLLFDPKMLYHELYYYFSSADNFGMIENDQYVSKGIKNKIVTPLTPKIVKTLQSKYDDSNTEKLITIMSESTSWPEIGLYSPILIKKYLIGIIVPKKYKDKIQKYIKHLNLTIHICADDVYADNEIYPKPKI